MHTHRCTPVIDTPEGGDGPKKRQKNCTKKLQGMSAYSRWYGCI
jgi:hypothetical protein